MSAASQEPGLQGQGTPTRRSRSRSALTQHPKSFGDPNYTLSAPSAASPSSTSSASSITPADTPPSPTSKHKRRNRAEPQQGINIDIKVTHNTEIKDKKQCKVYYIFVLTVIVLVGLFIAIIVLFILYYTPDHHKLQRSTASTPPPKWTTEPQVATETSKITASSIRPVPELSTRSPASLGMISSPGTSTLLGTEINTSKQKSTNVPTATSINDSASIRTSTISQGTTPVPTSTAWQSLTPTQMSTTGGGDKSGSSTATTDKAATT